MLGAFRLNQPKAGLSLLLPTAIVILSVLAAILADRSGGFVTAAAEGASSFGATVLGDLANALPLGYAFGAGMVAAVNPCGFALLPAYLGLYLGMFEDTATPAGRTKSVATALQVSVMVTAGFVLLFGAVGLGIGLLTSTISKLLPWTGLAIGVLLVFVGGRTVSGGMFYASAPERFAGRFGNAAGKTNLGGYFAYGLAYAAASLGCTLPIFLAVVGSTMSRGGLVPAIFQFLLYALGMGTVITVLTLGTALFKQAAVVRVRTVLPFVQPASAILLLGAGAYLIFYWLTIGGLLPR